jgi:hypothetical protein
MDEVYENLIQKFLIRSFPIKRIKHNGKFKRGIILNNKTFILKNKEEHFTLKQELSKILSIVFDCDYNVSDKIIKKSLNI